VPRISLGAGTRCPPSVPRLPSRWVCRPKSIALTQPAPSLLLLPAPVLPSCAILLNPVWSALVIGRITGPNTSSPACRTRVGSQPYRVTRVQILNRKLSSSNIDGIHHATNSASFSPRLSRAPSADADHFVCHAGCCIASAALSDRPALTSRHPFSLRTVSAINEDGGGREVFLRMIPEAKKKP
jgi:hypothetical protein